MSRILLFLAFVNLITCQSYESGDKLEMVFSSIDESLTKMFILNQRMQELENKFNLALQRMESKVFQLESALSSEGLPSTVQNSSTNSTSEAMTQFNSTTPSWPVFLQAGVTTSSPTREVTTESNPTSISWSEFLQPVSKRPCHTALSIHNIRVGAPCRSNIGNGTVCFDRTRIGLSCYCFVGFDQTWWNAMDYCKAHGMVLVSIETQSEDRVIELLTRQASVALQFPAHVPFWWSSGTNRLDSDFRWASTGEELKDTFSNLPITLIPGPDDGVLLVYDEVPHWDAWDSDTNWRSICEG